jgi:hypothetical protein
MEVWTVPQLLDLSPDVPEKPVIAQGWLVAKPEGNWLMAYNPEVDLDAQLFSIPIDAPTLVDELLAHVFAKVGTNYYYLDWVTLHATYGRSPQPMLRQVSQVVVHRPSGDEAVILRPA